MLNLPIAMLQVFILLFALSPALFQAQPSATTTPGIQVSSPRPGAALQGSVVLSGSTDLPGFRSYEIAFSYAGGGASWFLVQQSQVNVKDGVLGVWDTSKIADGDYLLRVEVTLADGTKVDQVISGLRVRNYTAIETSTPAPLPSLEATSAILAATATPLPVTQTPQPTSTALPANPLQMPPLGLVYNMTLGISFVMIVFGLVGLYLWAKGRNR